MSDKIKQTVKNKVVLTGVITELKVTEGVTKAKENKPSCDYISIKGEVQFGTHKAESRRFESFVQKINKKGTENGLYAPTLAFGKRAKSAKDVGLENATFISLQGEFSDNVYVAKDGKLKEGLNIDIKFFNEVDDFNPTLTMNENLTALGKGQLDIEGYIQNIVEEEIGEDATPTGRLKMNVVTSNYFSNAIPIKNVIIPVEYAEGLQSAYDETQTATFFLEFMLKKSEKVVQTGGLGAQRTTDGKSYLEMVLTGANGAIDEDEIGAISTEAIGIALKTRQEHVAEVKEAGYQGKGGTTSSNTNTRQAGLNVPNPTATIDDDDDLPF